MSSEEAPAAKRQKTNIAYASVVSWRIFPPPNGKPKTFAIGDAVFFRSKSAKEIGQRGKVVEGIKYASRHETKRDHVRVQFNAKDNKKEVPKYVSCKRLVPVFLQEKTTNIILTSETIPYRHLACSQVQDTDDILEIGCSTGEASVILLRYGRSWVGLDTSVDMIEQCTDRLKSSCDKSKSWKAVKADALSDPKGALKEAKKFNAQGPSVVFLDIGGNREFKSVLNMTSWVLQSFSNVRLIAIKSRELVATTISDSTSTEFQLDPTTGLFAEGMAWFQKQVDANARPALPSHPLKAPLVFSPKDATKPICRYHNYHQNGCSKDKCPYDHEHCHLCLKPGHIALNCDG